MKLQGNMAVNAQGHLEIGGCDTVQLAAEFGTPLYVLDEEHFRANCREYKSTFSNNNQAKVIYAGKALLTTAICRILDQEGLCLDVVSGGELYTALKANFPTGRIYFHGNNKGLTEICMALELNVGRIVVDSFDELELLNSLGLEMGKKADILLRLTPDIEADTHKYIQTGQIDSKFGLAISNGHALEAIKKAQSFKGIRLRGLHCHLGSQIFEVEPYLEAVKALMQLARQAKETTGWEMTELDLGGGLGIYYYSGDQPLKIAEAGTAILETVDQAAAEYSVLRPEVAVEPGRSIAGPAGTTLYTIGTIKEIPGVRTYVAVDGGMGDNPRPALYGAKYEAALANKMTQNDTSTVSIAGRCCESGDMLIWDIPMPMPVRGDILAVSATGAYAYAMASNYNRFPRPAMVMVQNGQADIVIERESYADLVRNDLIPCRLR